MLTAATRGKLLLRLPNIGAKSAGYLEIPPVGKHYG
jgi:hypothetical protein